MKFDRIFGLGGALLFACLSAGSLHANVLYSQPFDGSGFAATSMNDAAVLGIFARVYDNFTLASTSTASTFSWTGEFFNNYANSSPAPVYAWTVDFYANNAGNLGLELAEFTTTSANQTLLGTYNGFDAYSYSMPVNFTAFAGITYWVSIIGSLDYPPAWGWSGGSGGDGSALQLYYDNIYPETYDLAFTLSDSRTDSTATPEPASLALFGSGLALAACLRRKHS